MAASKDFAVLGVLCILLGLQIGFILHFLVQRETPPVRTRFWPLLLFSIFANAVYSSVELFLLAQGAILPGLKNAEVQFWLRYLSPFVLSFPQIMRSVKLGRPKVRQSNKLAERPFFARSFSVLVATGAGLLCGVVISTLLRVLCYRGIRDTENETILLFETPLHSSFPVLVAVQWLLCALILKSTLKQGGLGAVLLEARIILLLILTLEGLYIFFDLVGRSSNTFRDSVPFIGDIIFLLLISSTQIVSIGGTAASLWAWEKSRKEAPINLPGSPGSAHLSMGRRAPNPWQGQEGGEDEERSWSYLPHQQQAQVEEPGEEECKETEEGFGKGGSGSERSWSSRSKRGRRRRASAAAGLFAGRRASRRAPPGAEPPGPPGGAAPAPAAAAAAPAAVAAGGREGGCGAEAGGGAGAGWTLERAFGDARVLGAFAGHAARAFCPEMVGFCRAVLAYERRWRAPPGAGGEGGGGGGGNGGGGPAGRRWSVVAAREGKEGKGRVAAAAEAAWKEGSGSEAVKVGILCSPSPGVVDEAEGAGAQGGVGGARSPAVPNSAAAGLAPAKVWGPAAAAAALPSPGAGRRVLLRPLPAAPAGAGGGVGGGQRRASSPSAGTAEEGAAAAPLGRPGPARDNDGGGGGRGRTGAAEAGAGGGRRAESEDRGPSGGDPRVDEQFQEMLGIFNQYIMAGSPQEVNVSFQSRKELKKCVEEPDYFKGKSAGDRQNIFEENKREIMKLLDLNLWKTFVASGSFTNAISSIENEGTGSPATVAGGAPSPPCRGNKAPDEGRAASPALLPTVSRRSSSQVQPDYTDEVPEKSRRSNTAARQLVGTIQLKGLIRSYVRVKRQKKKKVDVQEEDEQKQQRGRRAVLQAV